MVKYTLLLLLPLLLACNSAQNKNSSADDALKGPISYIRMDAAEQLIPVQDFFIENNPDSIKVSTGFKIKNENKNWRISTEKDAALLGLISCFVKGKKYDLVLIKSNKISVELKFSFPNAKKVQIAGEMNNWSPLKLEKTADGDWMYKADMSPGKYQYQIIADEVWQLDKNNPLEADNGNGGKNSLLKVGEIPTTDPKEIVLKEEADGISFKFEDAAQEPIVLWENSSLQNQGKGSNYKYSIPKEAQKLKRTCLRGLVANKDGQISEFYLPLENGKIIKDSKLLTREDKHAQILYFMLVDRFFNGNPKNDDPVKDPEIHEKANYWGGDIEGITKKLKEGYFEKLGINTIWLSPITQNPLHGEIEYPQPKRKYSGYHGYWPISATGIDHRFGNEAALKALVAEAHKRNINVILDYVSNHVHQESPIYKKHPDWATDLILPDGTKNIRIWDEHRLTTWFDEFLPTLDYAKPEVVDLMTDSALYMLQYYDLDGFRHDATKHIPEEFWRALTVKIKKNIKKPVYQVGETFGSRALIGSYVSSGMMDGQFDFNLYFDMRSALAGGNGSFKKLEESLRSSFAYYGRHSLMGNITGNHDIARFISYAGKGLRFDEDDKAAGWSRDVKIVDTVGYARLKILTAFLMTSPGVPVIYYGDEIGMPGAGDPDNRRPMQFDKLSAQESSVYNTAKELSTLRRSSMSLMYGSFRTLFLSDNVWVYRRQYFDEKTTVILNMSAKAEKVKVDNVDYQIEANSFKIIK